MNPALTIASSVNPVDLLSTLTPGELVAADRCYPKWATMCQLRPEEPVRAVAGGGGPAGPGAPPA
jgi:hypothetical protein